MEREQIRYNAEDVKRRYQVIADQSAEARTHFNNILQTLQARAELCDTQIAAFEALFLSAPSTALQSALILHFVNGLSWPEVGAELGRTSDAVKKSVYRFLARSEVP